MHEINSIVLLGCKHCGKSTHGKALAKYFNVPFFDSDSVLEDLVKMPCRTFYQQKGVNQFMLAEEAACHKIIEENPDKQIVVATGGGICDNPPALQELRVLGKFIFLELDLEYSVSRILNKIVFDELTKTWKNAPAYVLNENPQSIDKIKEILMKKYTQRFDLYKKIADITVPLKNQEASKNFQLILNSLEFKK